MSTKGRGFVLAAGVLGSILAITTPAWAQSHGGGHGGGGHAAGGHFGGGGHASAGHFGGGAHYAAAGGFRGYGGAGYAHGYSGGYRGAAGAYGRPGAYNGHGYGYGGYGHGYGYGGYGHGYSTGAYWRGGYWHGGFWPRAYYGVGFSWFLPFLPLAYATYWYGGIPYYYANDVYYTYNPDYDGYVATDPPPAMDSGGAPAEGAAPGGPAAAPNGGPGPGNGGDVAGQIFMYPKNGQSPEQQAKDKAECQQWASQQAGQVAQNGSDYMRAMTACVEGRGYSAR